MRGSPLSTPLLIHIYLLLQLASNDPSTHWTLSQATFYLDSRPRVYWGHREHTAGEVETLTRRLSSLTYMRHQDPLERTL